ncbi:MULTISPECIES: chloride channel protein [Dickeya]|uniref:Chloride channel protein n=1 Tax=Dickeya aquatica TaxID=1401087 RepID=A0A375ABN0_9GAMM|nr:MULTISPECIES: chloride channel protein [Dickeya]SLM63460.1 Chloride channel protein [Dickeya aquatica]
MSDVIISPRLRLVSALRMLAALVLTGLLSGLGGMLLALLLHTVQHLAYGYSLTQVISDESFLQGVTQAHPLRRFLALLGCGALAGIGWYALSRYGRKRVSITAALQADKPRMPLAETVIHALLQIITVALGSPLGREVAPRELGALAACRLSHWLKLSSEDTRLLIACGAGGGLAAVYNVPLGGALFVLEVMLARFHLKASLAALFTCALAALVARFGLGNEYQYHLTMTLNVSRDLLVWAVLTSPIFGLAATAFVRITRQARQQAPRHARLILTNLLNFALLGLLVVILPQLAGNGKGPAELSFTSQLPAFLALVVLVCKVFIQWSSLRAGAHGGLLTPGLANGALLALVLGAAWSLLFAHNPPGAYAVIGAAAFLAASMNMPLTSLVLIMELTRLQEDFIVPIALCITGAVVTRKWLEQHSALFSHTR